MRETTRERAGFACEYCGVTETDAAGLLTLDHFQPSSQNGPDTLSNLVYCCSRCNQYKADYWPRSAEEPALWNPRHETAETHFVLIADGTLYALTPTGRFTLQRLRLNRPQLVAHRLRKRQQAEQARLTVRLRDIVALQAQAAAQQAVLLEENRLLLGELRRALRLALEERE